MSADIPLTNFMHVFIVLVWNFVQQLWLNLVDNITQKLLRVYQRSFNFLLVHPFPKRLDAVTSRQHQMEMYDDKLLCVVTNKSWLVQVFCFDEVEFLGHDLSELYL